jgi:hypothetical protein
MNKIEAAFFFGLNWHFGGLRTRAESSAMNFKTVLNINTIELSFLNLSNN